MIVRKILQLKEEDLESFDFINDALDTLEWLKSSSHPNSLEAYTQLLQRFEAFKENFPTP